MTRVDRGGGGGGGNSRETVSVRVRLEGVREGVALLSRSL